MTILMAKMMIGIGGCGDTLFSEKKTHMSSLRTTRCPSLLAKFVTMTRQISRAYHIDISNISNSNYNYIIDACNMNQTNNAGGHHTVDLGWAI